MLPRGTLVAFSGDGSGGRRLELGPAALLALAAAAALLLLAGVWLGWQLGEVAAQLGY